MYSKLLVVETQSNRFVLLVSLTLNILFFAFMALTGRETDAFMAASLITYWVLLIIAAAHSGGEKRGRLYAQLPVSKSQIFLAGWTWVLLWLVAQAFFWFLYALVTQDTISAQDIHGMASLALGILLIIQFISIGIELGTFRPAYFQWLYIGTIVGLLFLAVNFDLSLGVSGNDSGIHIMPLSLIVDGNLEIAIAALISTTLFCTNYFIYKFSDSFLS